MMMAGKTSQSFESHLFDFGGPRLAFSIQLLLLEKRTGFEISNEEQAGGLPVILLSVMHLVFLQLYLSVRMMTYSGQKPAIIIYKGIHDH